MTAEQLASLTRMTVVNVTLLAKKGVIKRTKRDGEVYDYGPDAVGDYIDFLRNKAHRSSDNKERKLKADAGRSELEEARVRGTLVLRSDYSANYADAVAKGVRAISKLRSLTTAQKEEVFAAIRSVELDPLPDEKESEMDELGPE